MMRRWRSGICAGAVAALVGCSSAPSPSAGPRDTLIFSAPADATTLDPHNTTDTESDQVIGMVFEGLFTWIMLTLGGVPMAALLGLVTGLLAFIPNIGAIVSGVLMVAVGFSAGPHQGFYAIFVYFFVQKIDGYLVVPYIARRTVDLAPALVLAAQLLFGALFGVLGLLLADPILASIKVTLEKLSEERPPAAATTPSPSSTTVPRRRRKKA